MMYLIMIFMILSSGSILGCVRFKKKFEEMLPITIFSIIIVIYIFGYVGLMRVGVYFIVALAIVAYFLSVMTIIKEKSLKRVLKELNRPSILIWLFMFIFLFILHNGRLLINWDEFSHWGDVVKAMYNIDDFATSINSLSLFKSYPPAISLFQYFFQVLNGEFNESLLFFAYQIVPVAILLSFTNKISWKNTGMVICAITIIMLVPLVLDMGYLSSIYVDTILSFVSGYVFTIILLDEKDKLFWIKLSISLFVLVLLKDAAKLFVFMALLMILSHCLFQAKTNKASTIKQYLNELKPFGIVLFVTFFAILSWTIEVKTHVSNDVFYSGVDYIEFLKTLLNRGSLEHNIVFKNFISAIFGRPLLSISGIELTYVGIIGLFLPFLYLCYSSKRTLQSKVNIYILLSFSVVYAIGLCMIYLFTLSSYEAMNLASFERYTKIYFIMMLVYISCVFLSEERVKINLVLLIALLLITVPLTTYSDAYYNKSINNEVRKDYSFIAGKVSSLLHNNKKRIYIVSQQSSGYDYWVLKFSLRDNLESINDNGTWSLGTPYTDEDIWTINTSLEKWKKDLKKNYDLLVLYKCDEIFIRKYGEAFSNIETIHSGAIYEVNKTTGLLDFVQ